MTATQNQLASEDLPRGWVLTQLGEVISVHSGEGLTKRNMKTEGKHAVYGGNGVAGYSDKYLIEESKVIIGRVGAKCGVVHLTLPKSWVTDNALIVNSWGMDTKFLLYALRTMNLNRLSVSTAQPVISSTKIYQLKFKLPPFNEQRHIASKVEELFSFLDVGVESLRKVKAQLKRYRQAVLKYVFEGKLTEEWRETHKKQIESAQKLLERIKQEKRKEPKYREMASINPSGLPEIPNSWEWTRLGEILFLSNDRCNPITSENQRFVGLEHIESGTGRLLGFGKSTATRSTKNRFKKGDLLYGKLRPYLNKVWVASFDGVCSTDILVFRKNSFLNNEYLAAFMLNQDFVEYTRQHMSGVQHPRISYSTLSQYILPIPPYAEQVVIAEKIQKTFSITENSEETMLQETKQAEILRQSILKVAFEGRLVPQNPNDESAKELLERIKAERFSNKESKLELPCYVK